MSITYEGLKEVQGVRQSKFAKAIEKSAVQAANIPLEQKNKADVISSKFKFWDLTWMIVFILFIIVAIGAICLLFVHKKNTVVTVSKVEKIKHKSKHHNHLISRRIK